MDLFIRSFTMLSDFSFNALTSVSNFAKAEDLPYAGFCCPCNHRYYILLRSLDSTLLGVSLSVIPMLIVAIGSQ